jgi:hypothetical protein
MQLEPGYAKLKEAWLRGERSREANLDLMFHSWMHWADPSFVSGLNDDPDALQIWHQIFEHFGGARSSDIEFLYVAQIMVALFPWALGDEGEWNSIGAALEQQLRTSDASRLSVQMFEERGEYGKYFAHQLRSTPPNTSLERTRER